MQWEHPEEEMVVLEQKELGELVVRVEAKEVGMTIMCQMELLAPSGPLIPDNSRASFTKYFRYSRSNIWINSLDDRVLPSSTEQIAAWIYVTSMTNWRGRLSHSKMDELRQERRDDSLQKRQEARLTEAYSADAKNVLDAAVGCCVAIHVTGLSIKYNSQVSRRMSQDKVRECWDRRVLLEVMKS